MPGSASVPLRCSRAGSRPRLVRPGIEPSLGAGDLPGGILPGQTRTELHPAGACAPAASNPRISMGQLPPVRPLEGRKAGVSSTSRSSTTTTVSGSPWSRQEKGFLLEDVEVTASEAALPDSSDRCRFVDDSTRPSDDDEAGFREMPVLPSCRASAIGPTATATEPALRSTRCVQGQEHARPPQCSGLRNRAPPGPVPRAPRGSPGMSATVRKG
jgi:hypothetical protein